MKTFMRYFSVAILVLSGLGASALEEKDARAIHVTGEASVTVPVDAVRITFIFPSESGTFEESHAEGKSLFDKIREAVPLGEPLKLETVYGWDLLRQSKISWGQKGRRINQKMTISVEGIPKGELHAFLAKTIDDVLRVDGKIELESIEVYLTDAAEEKAKVGLWKLAARKAKIQAKEMADAMGAQLGAVRFISNAPGMSDNGQGRDGKMYSMSGEMGSLRVRQSFKVPTEVPDFIESGVRVWAAYDIK